MSADKLDKRSTRQDDFHWNFQVMLNIEYDILNWVIACANAT